MEAPLLAGLRDRSVYGKCPARTRHTVDPLYVVREFCASVVKNPALEFRDLGCGFAAIYNRTYTGQPESVRQEAHCVLISSGTAPRHPRTRQDGQHPAAGFLQPERRQ